MVVVILQPYNCYRKKEKRIDRGISGTSPDSVNLLLASLQKIESGLCRDRRYGSFSSLLEHKRRYGLAGSYSTFH
ncbi:MAG: hypothetical protein II659_08500, partial [Bacteroidales bacterium]|nr:hypothetical protein [Bacteroidales bacterium]